MSPENWWLERCFFFFAWSLFRWHVNFPGGGYNFTYWGWKTYIFKSPNMGWSSSHACCWSVVFFHCSFWCIPGQCFGISKLYVLVRWEWGLLVSILAFGGLLYIRDVLGLSISTLHRWSPAKQLMCAQFPNQTKQLFTIPMGSPVLPILWSMYGTLTYSRSPFLYAWHTWIPWVIARFVHILQS